MRTLCVLAPASVHPGAEPTTVLKMVQGWTRLELADRLVQIWVRGEERLGELDALGARIRETRRRLAATKDSRGLAEAYLGRLLARRDACRAEARADRRAAAALRQELAGRGRGRRWASRAVVG